MTQINDVYSYLCELAPLEKQMSFDNAGFQLGRSGNEVHRALLALDVTDDVVREADHIAPSADLYSGEEHHGLRRRAQAASKAGRKGYCSHIDAHES